MQIGTGNQHVGLLSERPREDGGQKRKNIQEIEPAAVRNSMPFFPNSLCKDLAMWLISLDLLIYDHLLQNTVGALVDCNIAGCGIGRDDDLRLQTE